MKTYKAKLRDGVKGVYAISLVEDPAMEGHFVALNKSEIQLKTLDEEKRLLIGLVLEPEKPIYRNQDGEEFNIVFDSDTIVELSHGFFKNSFQLNSTIEHTTPIEGVTFVESWIVEDPKIDKSAVYGFSYPKGSWIATMKVDNQEVWDEYVKLGKVKGFSVDAMIDLEEVKLNKHNMSEETNKNLFETVLGAVEKGIKAAFSKKEEEEVKLGSVQAGDIVIEFDGEALEVGAPVWMTADDGTRVALPVGDYELETGMVLVVSEEGYAGEIKEMEAPKEEQAMSDDAPSAEALEKATEAIKKIMVSFKEENEKKMEGMKTEFEKQIKELSEKLIEFSEQPAKKKANATPEPVNLNRNGRILTKLRNAQ